MFMKVVVTGSLGHISKLLTEELMQKGHQVTVITSKAEKQKDIEDLGANAAVGDLEDARFLEAAFNGADVAYCMIPPNNYFDQNLDLLDYYRRVAANYTQAVELSGVKQVVYLSSVGAHLESGLGIIIGHHEGEKIMNELPDDVAIAFMRPVGFYYNLLGFIPTIKKEGAIKANFGAEKLLVWVSPKDIAAAVVEEIETPSAERKIRYVASDERSGIETARVLGAAIGKPDLKWTLIPGDEWRGDLEAIGMNPRIAAGLVEMYESQQNGRLTEDYFRNRPKNLGKVKLEDFAKDFAAVYQKD
jgi:uncharacterized protein YbjT (DUF2867 family)